MNRKIKSYLKTFFLTIAILNVIAFIPLLFHDFFIQFDPCLSQAYIKSSEYLNLEAYKLQRLKKEKPDDYRLNIELARIYMKLTYYVLAQNEYEEALKKEKNKSFIYFELADCYIIRKKYDEALSLIENIEIRKSKNFINKIYNKIKKYYPDTKSIPKIINKMYYKIGLTLCDRYVLDGKKEEALELLNELSQINDSNIINYKLGLLYYEQNPEKALKYFEKVYKSDYSIINYDLYKRLLENLQTRAYYNNDNVLMELYELKLKRLNFNLNTKYILDDDFDINIIKSKVYMLKPLKYVVIEFEVKNNTNLNYKNLEMTLVYETDDRIVKEKTFRLLNPKNKPIQANENSKKIKIRKMYYIGFNNNYNKYTENKIKIYLKKNKKTDKTLIGTLTLS